MNLLSLLRHGGHLGLFLHDRLLVLLLHLLLKLRRHLVHRGWVAPMSRLDVAQSMARCGMVLGTCRTCRQRVMNTVRDAPGEQGIRIGVGPCLGGLPPIRPSVHFRTLVLDGGQPSRTRVPLLHPHALTQILDIFVDPSLKESSTREETRHGTIE